MRQTTPCRRSACSWMRQARWKAAAQTPGPPLCRSCARWRCRPASATWAHARVQLAKGIQAGLHVWIHGAHARVHIA